MDETFRLAKPRKKGIFNLLFSRFFVIVVLLAIQVALTVSFYLWLNDLLKFFSVFLFLFTLTGVIYLFN